MPGDRPILLISDRPDQSQDLARRIGRYYACQTTALHEAASLGPETAVVIDVDLRRPADIDRLRQLLSEPRAAAAPIVAVLRDDSRLKRIQAAALGATSLFPANAAVSDILAALAPLTGPRIARSGPDATLTPAQNIEQARALFVAIFTAVGRGEAISRSDVDSATDSVMAAVGEGGIRQWLEVVWTYDDATYQHCMLVTGLAAGFAGCLHFADNDQRHLIRGALLHDVGKAKIPLGILNKPGSLNREELAVMRTHPSVGHDLLRAQGEFEAALLEVVLRHHELLDGSGYPDGLAGTQIPDLVRLVTICDIYAALIERRSYKQPMEPPRAFNILQDMSGKLEPALVRAFASVAEKSAVPAFA